MSKTYTYVRADDGLFYKDPVIHGDDWFICFDDEDPIELVVFAEDRKTAIAMLDRIEAEQGYFQRAGTFNKCGSRHHKQSGKYKKACSCWIVLTKPIPKPEGRTGTQNTKCPCTIYDPLKEYPVAAS